MAVALPPLPVILILIIVILWVILRPIVTIVTVILHHRPVLGSEGGHQASWEQEEESSRSRHAVLVQWVQWVWRTCHSQVIFIQAHCLFSWCFKVGKVGHTHHLSALIEYHLYQNGWMKIMIWFLWTCNPPTHIKTRYLFGLGLVDPTISDCVSTGARVHCARYSDLVSKEKPHWPKCNKCLAFKETFRG